MRFLLLALLCSAAASAQLTDGKVELVSDKNNFAEGPLYLPDGKWIFSDVTKNGIFYTDNTEFRRPSNGANGLTLDHQGRLIACESTRHSITRTEKDGTITVLADSYNGKPLNSTNDVTVGNDGTIYFTDPIGVRKNAPGVSSVYAIAPDGKTLTLICDDMKYPNGISMSPDGKILYVADFQGGFIRAYDVGADGKISNPRKHCDVKNPDGFKVDAAGRIWTSTDHGLAVFGPDGKPAGTVDFEGMATNCAFGDADGKTLVITARRFVYKVRLKEPGIVPAARISK